ncbi:siroheme synthase Met8 [Rhodotorula toruloides]|uniref:precorrin-2 dehydrogenase n=1 Tax=Rhodotorula toruloides TaxID=5286 RepID=A0A511KPL9_RHOTO|nr:siroheme synthase Met8 [Rhodotorula toruloides]
MSSPSPTSTPSPYPAPQPTNSLLLAYQVRTRTILLAGGGPVAASRLYHLLCARPERLVLFAPDNEDIDDEFRWRVEGESEEAKKGREGIEIEWRKQEFDPTQDKDDLALLDGDEIDMVLTAIPNPTLSTEICRLCRARRIPVNVADVPPECDFYFGSGKGPRVAARIRRKLERAIPENAGEAIENVGLLRKGLREVERGTGKEAIERRMGWIIRVSDKWSLAQLGEMDERMRNEVLAGWQKDEARGYWDVNRGKYGGLGWLASLASRFDVGTCPVVKDPDGNAAKCPFVMGSTGFVLGVATAGAAAAFLARR